MIDRVIARWPGAVASRIFHLKLKVDVDLFAGLYGTIDFLALVAHKIAAVQIYAVLGLNPIAMMFEQPFDAVEVAAFFVGREREDEIAVGSETCFFQADKIRHEDGGAIFDVHSASAIEITFLFDKLKGIGGPVFAARFDDVQVGEKQDRFLLAASMQAHD